MTERIRIRIFDNVARADAERAVRECPKGWLMELRPPTRTLTQNRKLWGMLTDISNQVEWFGRKHSPEVWKDLFSALMKQQEIIPGIEGGFVATGSHTSQMSISELSDMMEAMSAFGAEKNVKWGDDALSA